MSLKCGNCGTSVPTERVRVPIKTKNPNPNNPKQMIETTVDYQWVDEAGECPRCKA